MPFRSVGVQTVESCLHIWHVPGEEDPGVELADPAGGLPLAPERQPADDLACRLPLAPERRPADDLACRLPSAQERQPADGLACRLPLAPGRQEELPSAAPAALGAGGTASGCPCRSPARTLGGRQPEIRHYVVWSIPGDAAASGIWTGPHPRVWHAICQRLPGRTYAASGARLRRFSSVDEALEGWYDEAPGQGDPTLHRIQ